MKITTYTEVPGLTQGDTTQEELTNQVFYMKIYKDEITSEKRVRLRFFHLHRNSFQICP